MDKKQLHHAWTKVRDINPWYFFATFVVFGIIAVVSLRDNNLHMAKLREAVYSADESGGDVESALQDLRSYVGAHMNTSLSAGNHGVYPPIQLKYTYQRLVQSAGSQTSNANSEVYSAAQKYCEQQIPTGFSGRYRLDCIEGYVEQHGTGPVTNIPDNLYKFDFVSPLWSPDLAGFSIIAALLSFLLFGLFMIGRLIIQRLLS